MANYYSYNAGRANQNFGVSNPPYGSTSYNVQPTQQQSTYITPTHQVQQPQTAFVTYGHQQANFSSSGSQTQHYFQQGSTRSTANNSSNYYSNNQNQIKNDPPRTQMYATTTGGNYNQQQQQLAPVKQVSLSTTTRVQPQVSLSTTTRVQPVSQINFIGSKSIQNPTVMSSTQSSKSTSNYNQSQSQNITNYEKALISAASSIYQQQRKGGDGGGASASNDSSGFNSRNMASMPYWKQKRLQAQMNRDPNKPIVASEVKAYLYAWLGKERTRPEYNVTAHGNSPYRQTYVCEMVAHGFSFVGKGAASNKKDAQTRAAWDFCDYLVKEGKMKEEELPTRENKFKAANNKLPAGYKEKDSKQVIETVAKKKVVAKKINFVGGNALQLSASDTSASASTAKDTVVVYPSVSVEPAANVVEISSSSVPVQVVNVKTDSTISAPKALSANDVDVSASKNSPIGESYVEQVWTDGRVVRFHCKLCECEFNDPSAKELHVRGRRHRLSYKKKVDPSIEVDVKLNPKQKNLMMMKMRQEARKEAMRQHQKERQLWKAEIKKQQEEEMRLYEEEIWHQYQSSLVMYEEEVEFHRRRNLPIPANLIFPQRPVLKFFQPHTQIRNQQMKTLDDQHVMEKHTSIYPTEEELSAVQEAVQKVEGALKEVSSAIHEQEMMVYTASISAHASVKKTKAQPERLLKAVLRIGALAKGLLLRGKLVVDLVLMCNEKPTAGMLTRVADQLPKFLKNEEEVEFTLKVAVEECGIVLTSCKKPTVTVKVILTATQMRPLPEAIAGATKGAQKPDPPDILDRQKCCLALAALRHSKWYQAKANGLQSCVPVTRVIKDLCSRVPTWSPLTDWAVELIVERAISSATLPLSPSAALQRVLEAIAFGILLPAGAGLLDPCERDPTDAACSMTDQEREDITASAQHALRMITFRNIHKVLGIERIQPAPVPPVNRKRPNESGTESENKMVKQEK